ncbi:MAG: C25 family cysteine peptidase [bacterium]
MRNFLLGFVILSTVLPGEIIGFNNNWHTYHGFRIISETPSSMEIVFSLKEMTIDNIKINDISMQRISIPGIFLPNNEGAPNLPGMGRYIAIPQGAQARVTIISKQTEVYHNIDIAPAPNIPLETDTSPLRYKKDMAIYGRNAYYPDNAVIFSKPMKIRGVDVVIIGITPFQYNPITKQLIVYKDLRVRVDFIGGNGHFGEDRLRSLYWEPILQGHLLNYKSLPAIDFCSLRQQRDGYEYIIIVPDDSVFEAWADTIKHWRKLQGISTEVFTLSQVGGNTVEAIESFIDSAYNNWSTPPVAVLLLSDYETSGDSYGITTNILYDPLSNAYASDNWYADIDGDSLPDINIARIPAQTATNLDIMINKFLSYERSPYTDPGFYEHPLTACSYYLPRWTQLCAEILRGFLINELTKDPARQYGVFAGMGSTVWSTAPNTELLVAYFGESGLGYIPDSNYHDYGWWTNGSAVGINNAINTGAFIVQFRGYGQEIGWGIPEYTINDLGDLNNDKYPFAISISSSNGKYIWSTPCFIEVLYRMQHGILGAIASSGLNWAYVAEVYNLGVFDCLWSEFDPYYPVFNMVGNENLRPGFANVSAKYYLASHAWTSNPENKTIIYGLYHMYGDAFTTLYSEMPQNLTVAHPPAIIAGATSFTVQANDSSIIALTFEGEIIGVAEGTGTPINIPIIPITTPGFMEVTITKANYYRYEADVPVIFAGPWIAMGTTIIDDSLGGNSDGIVNPGETIDYGVWIKNVGLETAYSLYGLLFESDPYVSLTIDSSWYGDIPVDDSSLSNPFYNFDIADNCPAGHVIDLMLAVHDINDSIYCFYPSITVYTPHLTYQDYTVVDTATNNNGVLDPGETADLFITIKNQGNCTAESVTAWISCSSPYIVINDGGGYFGSIEHDSIADNAADPFNLTASGSTPIGTEAYIEGILYAGSFIDTLNFTIQIGKKHYYIWNPDPTPDPGANMHSILTNIGYIGEYGTSLVSDLKHYIALFVCCGIYPNNYIIDSTSAEAGLIVDYLENKRGCVYLEGAGVWYSDPQSSGYDFGPLFGTNAYGHIPLTGTLLGIPGRFTQGMMFTIGGENGSDLIAPRGTGFLIFKNISDDSIAVANHAGIYKTVGTSFELGLLNESTTPSTKYALLDSIMRFFIYGYGIEENTIATSINTELARPYPNPFNKVIQIRYQIADVANTENISLRIYDATGRLTKQFNDLTIGSFNQVIWDAKDDLGRKVPAGIYFVQFQVGDYKKTEKAILLK